MICNTALDLGKLRKNLNLVSQFASEKLGRFEKLQESFRFFPHSHQQPISSLKLRRDERFTHAFTA